MAGSNRAFGMRSARSLWIALESLHDVTYFDARVKPAGLTLGLRGFWDTYFAFRAAPLGAVDAGVVVATFAGFAPRMVSRAVPTCWALASPQACLDARAAVCAEALRAIGVTDAMAARVVAALAPVVMAADGTGRALFAANASVPLPEDPVAALWQLTASVREHRGDGHVAALVAAGLTGLDAHVLQVGAGRYPAEELRQVRGWTPDEWAVAAQGLQGRGLLAAADAVTDPGRALLAQVEAVTDELSWAGCLARLGDVDSLLALLWPAVDSVRASGILPPFNPTGLPQPSPSGDGSART